MRAVTLAAAALLVGCAGPSEGHRNGVVLKDVMAPSRQTAMSVLYGNPDNEDCGAISARVGEVFKASDSESSIRGLSSRDVRGSLSSYRAYFLPSQLIDANEAAFVFCQGENAELVSVRCRLIGITPRGCFQTGLYGIADASGIDAAVDAIHKNWPEPREKKKKGKKGARGN